MQDIKSRGADDGTSRLTRSKTVQRLLRQYGVLAACLIAAWCAGLIGCATPPLARQSMFMARLQDVDGRSVPQSRDNFGPGEVPTAVLSGYNGQTVTIDVYSLNSGAHIKRFTDYVPREHTLRWHQMPDLPNGSFKIHLSVEGNVVASSNFNVAR